MKIILGSKSKDKLKIVKKAFQELHIKAEVEGVEADSEITNQPLDKNITLLGAKNRAINAKKLESNADFWLGMEGGLHDYGEGYHLVTFACLIDKSNNKYFGNGTEIHLPKKVSDQIKKGKQFGEIIRLYAKDHNIDQNLISRETPFKESLQNAYANYLAQINKLIYRNKSSAVLINKLNQYLLVQLQSYGENDWNIPGGGIEEDESPEEALLRELKEELGTDNFKILEKSKIKDKYNFPDFVIVRELKKGNKYKGQIQTQFIVQFMGNENDIKIQKEEIRKYKWVDYKDLETHLTFPGQWKNIKEVIMESKLF
jgi:non-canonical (house-cleaning) NTP pyrophosphatase/8-oxo-dGTP pyrophosphatase MutT (NUDIX family)